MLRTPQNLKICTRTKSGINFNDKKRKKNYTQTYIHTYYTLEGDNFKEFQGLKATLFQTQWLGNVQKQIYLGKNAVDDGPVQEKATLFNELQNEIAVS